MKKPINAAFAAMSSSDEVALARARATLRAYDATWRDSFMSQYEVLSVEREFSFPLYNPDTKATSRSFMEAGKMDVLLLDIHNRKRVVMEHKSTSDDITPASDYWDRLRMDTQVSKYFLAAVAANQPVDGVLYNAIRRTSHSPKQVDALDQNQLKIVVDQNGNRVFNKDNTPRQSADTKNGWKVVGRPETMLEFEDRLAAILLQSPGDYFAQRTIPRLDSDILEYMEDAWATGQQLLHYRSKNLWPRNPEACLQFAKCEFFDLCCGRASVDNVTYFRRDTRHPELQTKEPNGLQFLTKSRAGALRKCPRLHKLRYEDQIRRNTEESEALRFGILIHAGLEAYFNQIKQNQEATKTQTV